MYAIMCIVVFCVSFVLVAGTKIVSAFKAVLGAVKKWLQRKRN